LSDRREFERTGVDSERVRRHFSNRSFDLPTVGAHDHDGIAIEDVKRKSEKRLG
jgi:hypothetical protein